MATLTLTVCDECGKTGKRLIRIDDRIYCSRDCYLDVCKRNFDALWMQELESSSHRNVIGKMKQRLIKVA